MQEIDEELKAQEQRMALYITMPTGNEYKPDLEKLRQQSGQFYYSGYEQEGQEPAPPPTAPPETPDEFNPHSRNFYQNTPGSDGSYVNDAFSKGYTYEHGNDSGSFESTPDFQGFQGYYDNSGFEEYKDYKGPDPYYRGYHGNTGNNPGIMSSGVPVGTVDGYTFTPDYDKLRRESGSFYYQNYGSGQSAQTSPRTMPQQSAAPANSGGMPYYLFSSVAHLWTAGGLLLTFITSLIAVKFPDIFIHPLMIGKLAYFAWFLPFFIFLISGTIIFWIVKKHENAPMPAILLVYAAFTGLTTAPILYLISNFDGGILCYSYLACCLVLAALSLISLFTQRNMNNIGFIFIGGIVALVIEYVIGHYAGRSINSLAILMTVTIILIAFNAFETTAVKRTFEKFISDDQTMYKNAVISAIGHYASIAEMLWLLIGVAAAGALEVNSAGAYGTKRGRNDMKFADSVKIDSSQIWK